MFGFFKKTSLDVSGRWTGFYKYDSRTTSKLSSLIVEFQANISMDNSIVSGIISEDEATGGISEIASMKGFLKGHQLCFDKTYPTRVNINDQDNFQADLNQESQIIMYSGLFDKNQNRFCGMWEIDEIHEINGRRIKAYSSGYWEMTRV